MERKFFLSLQRNNGNDNENDNENENDNDNDNDNDNEDEKLNDNGKLNNEKNIFNSMADDDEHGSHSS